MKNAIALFLIFSLVGCVCCPQANIIKLVGSTKSDVYHYDTCRYTKQIKLNKADYAEYKNPEDAIARGKRACKICCPPTRTERIR